MRWGAALHEDFLLPQGCIRDIAAVSETGAATNIIQGLAIGLQSCAAPVLMICFAIWAANETAGLYGIGIAAVAVRMTIDLIPTSIPRVADIGIDYRAWALRQPSQSAVRSSSASFP